MKLAIIGATGLVGRKILQIIEERNLAYDEIILAASENSVGSNLSINDKEINIISIKDAIYKYPDILAVNMRHNLQKINAL